MKVTGQGRLAKPAYMGNSKQGPYAAGTLITKRGDYDVHVEFFAPGDSHKAFAGAQANEVFEVEGELASKKDRDGNWRLQIALTQASRGVAF